MVSHEFYVSSIYFPIGQFETTTSPSTKPHDLLMCLEEYKSCFLIIEFVKKINYEGTYVDNICHL